MADETITSPRLADKNIELVGNLSNIKFYTHVGKSGAKDDKDRTIWDDAQDLIEWYDKCIVDGKLEGKKLDKLLSRKEYSTKINAITAKISKPGSGSVRIAIEDNKGLFKYHDVRQICELYVASPPYQLSKQEHKNAFMIRVKGEDVEASILELMTLYDKAGRSFVERVNKIYIDGTKSECLKLKYRSIFIENSKDFYLNIAMKKTEIEKGKWSSTGYPGIEIKNEAKQQAIKRNGQTRYQPIPYTNELHENNIHLLFGEGSRMKTTINFTWAVAETTFSLKVRACAEMLLLSIPNTTSNIYERRYEEAFGKYTEFEVVGDTPLIDNKKEISPEEALALESLHIK